MKRVVIESPHADDTERNVRYVRACLKDCLTRDEAPIVGYSLYTQALNEDTHEIRTLGMEAGFLWNKMAEMCVVYTDLGLSKEMKSGIETASHLNIPIQFRSLGPGWDK
jgi:hypothetical protein